MTKSSWKLQECFLLVVGFFFFPPFPWFVIQKGMQACVPATQSIDCFCLQRGCCQVAARVESGIDTGLLGSGPRQPRPPPCPAASPRCPAASQRCPRAGRAPPPRLAPAAGSASMPSGQGEPRVRHARAPSQAAQLWQGQGGLGRRQECAPRRQGCPLRLPLAPASSGPPAQRSGAALLGTCGCRPGQGQVGPFVGHGAEEPPQIPSQAPGQPGAVVVRVRLCPRLGPPRAGELILPSPGDLEDAPGKESEVWWCRQLFVMCLDVCLVVYSGNSVCEGKLLGGHLCVWILLLCCLWKLWAVLGKISLLKCFGLCLQVLQTSYSIVLLYRTNVFISHV